MIKIALCDDDVGYLKSNIRDLIFRVSRFLDTHIEICIFSDGNQLVNQFVTGHYYDIVILDIDMPNINGKELAKKLRDIDSTFFLVFLTSYKMEIFNTVQYKFNAFIPKENAATDIESELNRVISEYMTYKPEFELFEILRNGILSNIKVTIQNILYFYFYNKQIFLKTTTEELLLNERVFSVIVEKYRSKGFYESYRNYLLNVGKVIEISDNYVIMCNGEKLPVSKRYKKGLIREFADYILMEETS